MRGSPIGSLLLVSITFSFVSSLQVLVTHHLDWTQFSCFSEKNETKTSDCCQEIERAVAFLDLPRVENCLERLAQVPVASILTENEPTSSLLADFSLVISSQSESSGTSEEDKRMIQYQWNSQAREFTTISPPILSPFVLHPSSDIDSSSEETDYRFSVDSTLADEGGMHRVMTTEIFDNYKDHGHLHGTYLIVYQIPEGMFVDLDDFLIVDDDFKESAIVHSAKVCDIEKTSFVGSGQHVVILQLPSSLSRSMTIQTKWHTRYPRPLLEGKRSKIQNFMSPTLLFLHDQGNDTIKELRYIQDPVASRMPDLYVATGYDQDHDTVMSITVLACLIGVIIMLRDIANVSYWD